ncbi:MAG: ABC-2 family transporter protein [Erysipelotrichales bacterium]|nr:ABC-2 family transporter protein [Erysipelotrichales bacterium]
MKRISNGIKKYIPFFRAGLKSFLVYKAQVYGWLLIGIVEILFLFFLYNAIYKNSNSTEIGGFTFYEMILYGVTSFVFANVVSSETGWNIFVEVRDGTIVNTLTKPVSYRLRHLFTCFGEAFFKICFVAFPLLVVIYGIFLGCGFVAFNPIQFIFNILFFIIFMILAIVINDSIQYIVGVLTFYTQHMFGLDMFFTAIKNFLSGAMVPLSYMGMFGVVFSYLPFAFLASTPILILMGKVNILRILMFLGIAIGYEVLLEVINHSLFRHCVKKIVVQGG